MSLYIKTKGYWWTNGNDGTDESVWIWPINGGNFGPGSTDVFSNWGPGNVSLSYISDL